MIFLYFWENIPLVVKTPGLLATYDVSSCALLWQTLGYILNEVFCSNSWQIPAFVYVLWNIAHLSSIVQAGISFTYFYLF